jgi:hypothetical protein
MSPTGVHPRRGLARPAARRRSGGPGRFAGETAPPLFSDGGEMGVAVQTPVEAPETAEPGARAERTEADRGDGMTLEELICGVWDEVVIEGRTACPLCGGELEGRASAHSRPTEGRCRDCGTTIA